MKNNQRHMETAAGGVVLIEKYDKHKSKWNVSIVGELYEVKDNTVRAVKLLSKKTYIERPIQFFYPLELSCDTQKRQKTVHQCRKQPLNVNASEFKPRRNAAAIPEVQIRDAAGMNKYELQEFAKLHASRAFALYVPYLRIYLRAFFTRLICVPLNLFRMDLKASRHFPFSKGTTRLFKK